MTGVPVPPPVFTSDSPLANGALTHQELQFIAESELVEIVPAFSLQRVEMLCGTIGPLRPQISKEVPLWMAVDLKRKQKCTVKPPDWLSPANLEAVLGQERADESNFQPLPFHYIEIATLLFKFASDDFPEFRASADLFDAIRSVRLRKIENGLRNLDPNSGAYIRLANICAMEVNIVRPFFSGALNRFHSHSVRESAASGASDARVYDDARDDAADRPRRNIRRRGPEAE